MALPTLIIVSGHPASGKTTLAHEIARAIPCPAICRDEIKEGLIYGRVDERPALGDQATKDATDAFFAVIEVLLNNGVTHVAEAAFQHGVWAPKIEPLLPTTNVRIIRCVVAPDVAVERMRRRPRRRSHADDQLLAALDSGAFSFEEYDPLNLDVPTLTVDTTDGYRPVLDDVVAFVR